MHINCNSSTACNKGAEGVEGCVRGKVSCTLETLFIWGGLEEEETV